MRFFFSAVASARLAAAIAPAEPQTDNLNILNYEGLSPEQAFELSKNRLAYQSSLPWSRGRFFDTYEPSPDLRSQLEGRRRDRWNWYSREWGGDWNRLSQRDLPVVRFRTFNGNLTFDRMKMWEGEPDSRFFRQGACFVNKASFYDRTTQRLSRAYYDSGSAALSGWASVFGQIRELMNKVQFSTILDEPEDMRTLKHEQPPHRGGRRIVSDWLMREVFLATQTAHADAVLEEVPKPRERRWTDFLRGSASDEEEARPSSATKATPDFKDIFGPDAKVDPQDWVLRNVIQRRDLKAAIEVAHFLVNVIKSMKYWELQNNEKLVHPTYMESVNIELRQNALVRLHDELSDLLQVQMDYTVKHRKEYFKVFRDLRDHAESLNKLYDKVVRRWGRDRYVVPAVGGSFTRPDRNKIQRRATAEEEKAAKKTLSTLKSIPEKILATSGSRVGTTSTTARLENAARPTIVVEVKVADIKTFSVQILRWNFNKAFREDVETEYKFKQSFTDIIKRSLEDDILKNLVLAAPQPTQVAYSEPGSVHQLTVYVKAETLCYYDSQIGKSRMLEILELAVPGLERFDLKFPAARPKPNSFFSAFAGWDSDDADETDDQRQREKVIKEDDSILGIIPSVITKPVSTGKTSATDQNLWPADQLRWITAGFTYDSWVDTQSAGKSLLEAYIRDQAEKSGIMTISQNQYQPTQLGETCSLNDLTSYLIKKISSDGPKKSRVAPQIGIRAPTAVKPNAVQAHDPATDHLDQVSMYRICLNVVPADSQAYIKGNPIPGLPKENFMSVFVTGLKHAHPRPVGRADTKSFQPMYMFAELENLNVKFSPALARKEAQKLKEAAVDEATLKKLRTSTQNALYDGIDSDFRQTLKLDPPFEEGVVRIPEALFVPADVTSAAAPHPEESPLSEQSTLHPTIYAYSRCDGAQGWSALQRITGYDFTTRNAEVPPPTANKRLAQTDPAILSI